MNNTKTLNIGVFILLFAMMLSSCAPAQNQISSPTLVPTASPEATFTPAPLLTVKVATYNILLGAGRDRANNERLPDAFKDIDRTPLLIDYLKRLDADIVGLQETTGWDSGSPPYIKTLADQLGMNYFISKYPEADSALITKYEILDAEELSSDYNSIVRVRLLGPDGEPLNVFVAHLDSDSPEHRACGVEFLLQETRPFLYQRTILMGDMNFKVDWNEWGPKALKMQDWQVVAIDGKLGIDQIWAAPSMQWNVTGWTTAIEQDIRKISDHLPIGRELQIHSLSGDQLPVATLTVMPPISGFPAAVTETTTNVRIAFVEQPDAPCKPQAWDAGWVNESSTRGELRLFGKKDWQAGANWSALTPEGGGVFLDFKYNTGSEFNIFLDHGMWEQPDYRRFGLYVVNDMPQSDMWKGGNSQGGERWSGIAQSKPDTWYRLLMAAGVDGHFAAYLWEIDDPSNIAVYQREMDTDWVNLQWRLATGANQGRVFIKSVTQIIFDTIE